MSAFFLLLNGTTQRRHDLDPATEAGMQGSHVRKITHEAELISIFNRQESLAQQGYRPKCLLCRAGFEVVPRVLCKGGRFICKAASTINSFSPIISRSDKKIICPL